MIKNYTNDDLMKYNGEQGSNVYIVHNNFVYDLSKSSHWKNGLHMNAHHAGMDLTKALNNAPHGTEVFINFPMVGILVQFLGRKKLMNFIRNWKNLLMILLKE